MAGRHREQRESAERRPDNALFRAAMALSCVVHSAALCCSLVVGSQFFELDTHSQQALNLSNVSAQRPAWDREGYLSDELQAFVGLVGKEADWSAPPHHHGSRKGWMPIDNHHLG